VGFLDFGRSRQDLKRLFFSPPEPLSTLPSRSNRLATRILGSDGGKFGL